MNRILFPLMALCFLLYGLSAAGRPEYTLEECIEIGLLRSERLRNALLDERIAATSVGEVRSQALPQLSASAGYTRLESVDKVEFGDQSLEIGSLDNYSADLRLRQLVYAGGLVRAGLRAAHDYRDMTAHRTAQIKAELIRDIRAGFVDLLLLEAVTEVHEQTVVQLREVLSRTEQRFEQANASEFDVLNARVRLANALPGLINASNQWSVAQTAFGNLINVDNPDFAIAGQLAYESCDEPLEALMARALARRPEILVVGQRLTLQEADIRIEQGSYYPHIHIDANYGGREPRSMISGGSGLEWSWNVGIQAHWTWLDGGARRSRILKKNLERDKTVADMAALRRNILLQARQAWLSVRHASEAVAASRETVALADKSLDIARVRYETGLTTRLEYTEVSLARMQARLNRLQALRDHRQAVNNLLYAIGDY